MSLSTESVPLPWSLRAKRLGLRGIVSIGAGALIASFYIGTADISVASNMGAWFGYRMWWTYFVLGIAGFAIIDMSVRYFLQTGRTPMSMFKEIHPALSIFMILAVVEGAIYGSYGQWNACAMVIAGLFPIVPLELAGFLAAVAALVFLLAGVYMRVEKVCLVGLIVLIVAFFAAAILLRPDWGEALRGLIPRGPQPRDVEHVAVWRRLFGGNAGSIINAWLILIFPYTMMEKRRFSRTLQGKVDLLHRSRWDYGFGILAAAIVALPIMACADSIARPFGITPKSHMDLSVLLEPVAGTASTKIFLTGLFLAAWTSGVGWWVAGAYALLDIFRLPIRLDSRPTRVILLLFFIPSVLLLFLRINPVYQIIVFAGFLALIFPVMALAVLWRVTRRDMGYFGWNLRSWRGRAVVAIDLFAIAVGVFAGATQAIRVVNQIWQ